MSYKDFQNSIELASERITNAVEKDQDIILVGPSTVDSLIASSILLNVINHIGGRAMIRIAHQYYDENLLRLKDHNLVVVVDYGINTSKDVNAAYGNNCLIINHQNMSFEEKVTDNNESILNPWKNGINGYVEISSGGISYLVAKHLHKEATSLNPLAITSALADNQDVGEKKSLVGLNQTILEEGKNLGSVVTDIDLLLFAKDKSVHESISETLVPYIHGLTFNPKNCIKILEEEGLLLKINQKWKKCIEMTQEEKFIILRAIAKYLQDNEASQNIETSLIGVSYLFPKEKMGSLFYDGRLLAFYLNCCLSSRKHGLGISICLGDRSRAVRELIENMANCKTNLQSYIQRIFHEGWRISTENNLDVLINCDNIVGLDHLNILCQVLATNPQFKKKLLILKRDDEDGKTIYFLRSGRYDTLLDIGEIAKESVRNVTGYSEGNNVYAFCIVPSSHNENFLSTIRRYMSIDKNESK